MSRASSTTLNFKLYVVKEEVLNNHLANRLGLRTVVLYEDGVCIGQGELSREGTVLECRAPLSDDVFDALEDAIEAGVKKITIGDHEYSWHLP